jgi:peptide/nickel transport system substrate-binding protein
MVTTLTSNRLMRTNPACTEIVPDLAQSLEQPDDVTYIFKLNQGVKFHNVPPANGREFTAEDVKYSLERQMTNNPLFVHASFFRGIVTSIDVVDRYTVKVVTNRPYAPLLNYIANPWSTMKCREAVDQYGDLKTVAIGTGPFIFKHWSKGIETVLVKNPDYFRPGRPYIDQLTTRYVPDASTATSMFLGGEIDVVAIDWTMREQVKKQKPDATYTNVESIYPFLLRTQPYDDTHPHKPPMDNLKVRQAIQLAVNKQDYIDAAMGGNGIPLVGVIPPSRQPWALPDSDQIKQDINKAKQLMAEAGYPNGFQVELIVASAPITCPDSATVAKGQLAKIGIDVQLKLMEDAQYRNKVYSFDYMLNMHNGAGSPEPEEYLKPYFGANAAYYKWGNLEIQKKVEEQSTTMDPQKRKELIWEIQRMIQADAPLVPLYVAMSLYATQPRVKNQAWYWNQYDFITYENVWLDS